MKEIVASIEWCKSSKVRHRVSYTFGLSASGAHQSMNNCGSARCQFPYLRDGHRSK